MNWQEFTALLVLATAMTFSPGPNTTLSTALAANGGMRSAMRFVVAVPVGWGALLLLTATGLGALIHAVPPLRLGVKTLGISYLLWLAWKLSQSGQLSRTDSAPMRVGFWQGVGLQFLNIKAWLLALTLVAGWVAGQDQSGLRTTIILLVMLFFGFCSNFTYAAVGALLRAWLAEGRRLLWFNRCMALVLVVTALWMVKA